MSVLRFQSVRSPVSFKSMSITLPVWHGHASTHTTWSLKHELLHSEVVPHSSRHWNISEPHFVSHSLARFISLNIQSVFLPKTSNDYLCQILWHLTYGQLSSIFASDFTSLTFDVKMPFIRIRYRSIILNVESEFKSEIDESKSCVGLFTWSVLFFEPYLKRSLLLTHFTTSNTWPSGSRVLEKNRFLVDSSTFFQRSSNIEKAQQNANLRHSTYNKLTSKDFYATLKKVRWVAPV